MYSPLSGEVVEVNQTLADSPATVSYPDRPRSSSRTATAAHASCLRSVEVPKHLLLQVNKDPYKAGWIIKVKISNKAELNNLLDAKTYEKQCEH